MKFAWIICMLIIVFDSVQMRSLERDDEDETDMKRDSKIITDKKPESQVSAKIKNNTNRSSLKTQVPTSGGSKVKNHPKSKEAQRGPSFVPTTRRPLMKTRKFTTKPHTVYRKQSNEQRNYSRRRHSNSTKRHRHQNERNSNQVKSNAPESTDDRFKDFKDSDELEQIKNTRPSGRVRSLIPAASEKFIVRTLPQRNSTIDNIFRTKAKLAIEESLQKFKGVKPATKGNAINTDSSSSGENESIEKRKHKQKKAELNNISNNPMQSTTDFTSTVITRIPDEIETITIKTETPKQTDTTTTPKFDYNVTKSEMSVVDSTITTTEKSNIPASEKPDEIEIILIKTETPKQTVTTTAPKFDYNVTKSEMSVVESTITIISTTTEKSNIPAFEKPDEIETIMIKTEIPKQTDTTTTTPKFDYNVTKSEMSVVESTITTTQKANIPAFEKPDEIETIITKIEPPKQTVTTTTPKFDYNVTKSEISVVDSTITTTEKSNIPASEVVEDITDNEFVSLDERADSNDPIATKEIVTSTEISPPTVDSLLTIKELEQLLTRRKRANNIIEEEPVATTSYGLELNRQESPINVDLSYNNIHI